MSTLEDRVINFLKKYDLDLDGFIRLTDFNALVRELNGKSDLPYVLLYSKMEEYKSAEDYISFYDTLPILCNVCEKESVSSPIEILESLIAENVCCGICLERIQKEKKEKVQKQKESLKEKQLQQHLGVRTIDDDSETRGYFALDKKGNYKFIENENEVFSSEKRKVYYDNAGAGTIEEDVVSGYLDADGKFVEGAKPPTIKMKEVREQNPNQKKQRYVPKRNAENEIEHVLSGDSSDGEEQYNYNPNPISRDDLEVLKKLQRDKEEQMRIKREKYHAHINTETPIIEENDSAKLKQFERTEYTSASNELAETIKSQTPSTENSEGMTEEDLKLLHKAKENVSEKSIRVIPD